MQTVEGQLCFHGLKLQLSISPPFELVCISAAYSLQLIWGKTDSDLLVELKNFLQFLPK